MYDYMQNAKGTTPQNRERKPVSFKGTIELYKAGTGSSQQALYGILEMDRLR